MRISIEQLKELIREAVEEVIEEKKEAEEKEDDKEKGKKLKGNQYKIATVAEPKSKITAADFKKLRDKKSSKKK